MTPTGTVVQTTNLPTMIETSAWGYAAQFGVVGLLCILFAVVIYRLYRENRADRKEATDKEKVDAIDLVKCHEACRVEKETLRADYERRHREILEGYSAQMMQFRATSDKREDEIRRETTGMIERLANANKDSSEALVEMLQQFLNKVVK